MSAPTPFTRTAPVGHYIQGEIVAGSSGRSQAVYNPSTGAVAREVVLATQGEVEAAIATGNIQHGTITGKLNGVMPATTPRAWRIVQLSMPVETCSV